MGIELHKKHLSVASYWYSIIDKQNTVRRNQILAAKCSCYVQWSMSLMITHVKSHFFPAKINVLYCNQFHISDMQGIILPKTCSALRYASMQLQLHYVGDWSTLAEIISLPLTPPHTHTHTHTQTQLNTKCIHIIWPVFLTCAVYLKIINIYHTQTYNGSGIVLSWLAFTLSSKSVKKLSSSNVDSPSCLKRSSSVSSSRLDTRPVRSDCESSPSPVLPMFWCCCCCCCCCCWAPLAASCCRNSLLL